VLRQVTFALNDDRFLADVADLGGVPGHQPGPISPLKSSPGRCGGAWRSRSSADVAAAAAPPRPARE